MRDREGQSRWSEEELGPVRERERERERESSDAGGRWWDGSLAGRRAG